MLVSATSRGCYEGKHRHVPEGKEPLKLQACRGRGAGSVFTLAAVPLPSAGEGIYSSEVSSRFTSSRRPSLPPRSWPLLILSLSYHYTSSIFLLFYLQYYTRTLLIYPFLILNYNILGARTESHSSLHPHLYEGAWNQGGTWPADSGLQNLLGLLSPCAPHLACRLDLGMLCQSREQSRR